MAFSGFDAKSPDPSCRVDVTTLLNGLLKPTKFQQCVSASSRRGHAKTQVVFDLQCNMSLEFLADLAIMTRLVKRTHDSKQRSPQMSHFLRRHRSHPAVRERTRQPSSNLSA